MSNQERGPTVVISGPPHHNSKYCVEWIRQAYECDRLLLMHFEKNSESQKSITQLIGVEIDFTISSLIFMDMWLRSTTFVVDLHDLEGETFAVMSQLGFFTRISGNRYRKTVPTGIDIGKIIVALERLIATEDTERHLWPERIVL